MSQGINSSLIKFVVRLGDNNLILGHRLSEWCSKGPFLEEDIAMSNIALDYIGQARVLYSYAGQLDGGKNEDYYAYERREHEFTNALLCETPNGDFGMTVARQLYYSVFAYALCNALLKSKDETLSGYAGKAGIDELWMYTHDLFATLESDKELVAAGIIPDVAAMKGEWLEQVKDVIQRATLTMPDVNAWQMEGSRKGRHTENIGYIISELQYVTRAYPGCEW